MPIILHTKEEVHSQNNKLLAQEQLRQEFSLRRLKRSGDIPELPQDFKIGEAVGGGDCFFDAVVQGLEQLKPDMKIDVKFLRRVLKEFIVNDQKLKDEIRDKVIKDARNTYDPTITPSAPGISDDELWNVYLASIEYTSEEIEKMRVDNPSLYQSLTDLKYGSTLQTPIWGRPDVEGYIICKKYNVKLHIIEKQPISGWSHQILGIDESDSKFKSKSINNIDYNDANTIHVINRGSAHFQPVIGVQDIRYKRSGSSSDESSDDETGKKANLVIAINKGNVNEFVNKLKSLLKGEVKTNLNIDDKGNSPLHYSVTKAKKEIIEELLSPSWETDINSQNNEGNTALHIASSKSNKSNKDYLPIIELLLENGVDRNKENKKNQKPSDLSNDKEISNLIKSYKRGPSSDSGSSSPKSSISSNSQQSSDPGQQTTNKRPFSETDSQEEEVGQTKKQKTHKAFLDELKFSGQIARAGIRGNLFQLKLLMLFLRRAENNKYHSFRIATEKGKAEKFDDVVLQYTPNDSEKWKFRLLQAKHKDEGKIEEKELLSTNNDDPFSLQKYFHSYIKINRRIDEGSIYSVFTGNEVEDLIICTNTDFDSEQLRSRFAEKNIEDDQVLRLDKKNNPKWKKASVYKLENTKDELIKKLKPILEDTSDFNRLVEELSDKILSDGQIDNKDLFKEYYYPLISDIFDINSLVTKKEGGSKKYHIKFLKQQSNDVRVQDFMNSLLREIIFKDKGSKGDSWENKAIKISKNFGKTPLPSDEGQLKKIAKVLAEKIRNNEELTPLDFLDQNVSESKYYHIALIKDKVINVKDKKFYGDFFKKSGGHLRDYLRDEMYKMGEIKVKTFAALERLLKNIELNISEEFGKEKRELPNDYAKLEELAKDLAEKIKKGEELTRSDFEDYHVGLAKELIDIKTGKFQEIFINRKVKEGDSKYNQLSSLSKTFRRIFLDNLIKIEEIQKQDIEWVYKREIRVSDGFKKASRAIQEPNIDNPVLFAQQVRDLLQSGQSDKVIKINDDTVSDDRNLDAFKKNINFLAGHVLIKKYDKIRFSTSFLRSDNKNDLPGNLITFRNELKNILEKDPEVSFESIYEYEFKIDFSDNKKFKTCEEGALNRKLPILHNDKDVEDFFDKLKFVVNYPNQEQMNELLEHNIKEKLKILDGKAHNSLYRTNLEDWMADRVGTFYTPGRAVELFKEIEDNLEPWTMDGLSLSYFAKAGTEYKFQEYDTISKFLKDEDEYKDKKVLDITFKDLLLGSIRVCQSFQDLQESNPTQIRPYIHKFGYIFLRSSELSDNQFYKKILNWFKDEKKFNLLVIECDTELDEQKISEINKGVINKKKVILLNKEGNVIGEEFAKLFNNGYQLHPDSTTFYDLTPNSRKTLLGKEAGAVIFQGKEGVRLGELITEQDLENNRELGKAIEGKVLSDLVTHKRIEVGKALTDWKYDDVKDYYIPRKFYRHINIRIKEDFNDKFFVIYNYQVNEFNIPPHQEIVLVSDIEDNFKNLCYKYEGRNIHWLKKKETDNFIWQQSQGSLSKIREFIDVSSKPSKFTEELNDKIVIIAAEPGMGKSTVLTHLAVKTKEIDPSSSWIVRVNLLDHSSVLSKWKDEKTIAENEDEKRIKKIKKAMKFIYRFAGFKLFEKKETQNDEDHNQVIDYLLSLVDIYRKGIKAEIYLKDSEEKTKNVNLLDVELFNHFYNQGKIVLMFDGFDEISPRHKDKAIELLETLKNTGKVEKLLITTRRYPYVQSELEDKLNIFSYSIKDFSEQDQKEFLKRFWEKKLKIDGLGNERFTLFTNELINKFSQSIRDREEKFMGIALHTMMIAEVFKDIFKRFYLRDSQELSNEDKQELSQKLNLATLYEHFIETKFKEGLRKEDHDFDNSKYKPRMEKMFEEEKEKLIKNHKILALYTLFKVEELEKLFSQSEEVILEEVNTLVEEIKNADEKNGIIDRISDDGKPIFVHRTFAEYFASELIFDEFQKKLTNPRCSKESQEKMWEFLLDYIFIEEECNVIRNFINCKLSDKQLVDQGTTIRNLLELRVQQEDKTQLLVAISEGLVEIVKFLLENAPDGYVDVLYLAFSADDDSIYLGLAPLHLAAKIGNKDIVDILINHVETRKSKNELKKFVNARANDYQESGDTPLHLAAENGHKEIVDLLLYKGAKVNARTPDLNITPLHLAARNGHKKVVEVLLKNGADVNARKTTYFTYQNETPLHLAVQNGHKKVVEVLLDYAKEKLSSDKFLEFINATTVDQNETTLHLAVQNGNKEIVEVLLKNGADVNARTSDLHITPLHLAVQNGNKEVVEVLLRNGANIEATDIHDKKASSYATDNSIKTTLKSIEELFSLIKDNELNKEQKIKIEKFIEDGGIIGATDVNGYTLVHYAASKGYTEIINSSIEYVRQKNLDGLNNFINAKTSSAGYTVLHLAVQNGHKEVVNTLLNKGAMVDIKTNGNLTPLKLAVLNDNKEIVDNKGIVEALLKNGANIEKALIFDIEEIDNSIKIILESTKKLFTVIKNNELNKEQEIEHLIRKGGVIGATDNEDGYTLLHYAVQENYEQIIDLLLEKGADPTRVAVNEGNTPLHLAASEGYTRTINSYLRRESRPSPLDFETGLDSFPSSGFSLIWCLSCILLCKLS